MNPTRPPPSTSDSASQTSPIAGMSEDMGDEQPSTSSASDRASVRAILAAATSQEAEQRAHRSHRSSRRRRRRAIMEACRIPSSMPVKGESYCECPRQGRDLKCACGEEDDGKISLSNH